MTWNACSLLPKLNELELFMITNNILIAMIQETWLTPSINISLPHYNIIRKDNSNGKPRGGVAILIHKNLKFRPYHLNNTSNLQAVAIQLLNLNLIVISAYCPDQSLNSAGLDSITTLNLPFITGADLNAKHPSWNNGRANSNGKVLDNHITDNRYSLILPSSNTHFRPNCLPTTIDFFLADTFTNLQCEVSEDLSSDHRPVLLLPNIKHSFATSSPITNWETFLIQANKVNITPHINSPNEIDLRVTQLQRSLKTCFYKSTSFINTPNKFISPDEKLKYMIKLRNTARKKWQRSHNLIYLEHYKNLNKSIQNRVKWLKYVYIRNEIKNTKNTHSFWPVFRKIMKKPTSIPPLLDNSGNYHDIDKQKAQLLAEQFSSIFNEAYRSKSALQIQVNQKVQKFHLNEHFSPSPCIDIINLLSPRTIRDTAINLKSRKACGWDGIAPNLIKKAPRNVFVQLYYIFKACFQHAYFPKPWKTAKVIPIPKPGKNHKLPSSYRPISLLPILGKLFEKTIYKILRTHIDKNDILINPQFGFRNKHSTIHQLIRTAQFHTHHMNIKRFSGMVLLDLNKAFDSVWHNGLIAKLIDLKFHPRLIKLIHFYLENRTFFVQVGNQKSNQIIIKAGVPQGSVLAPLLFLLYINDIPFSKNTSLALFADDTAIMAASLSHIRLVEILQEHLDLLNNFFIDWKMKLNGSKTQAIIFTRRRKHLDKGLPRLKIMKEHIEWNREVKYLGVILDAKMNWGPAVLDRRKKTVAALGASLTLIGEKSKLKTQLKILIYKTCIRSVMTYGVHLWHIAANSHLITLQRLQNKAIKIILGLPMDHSTIDIHIRANIPMLDKVFRSLVKNYDPKDHPNPLIRNTALFERNLLPYSPKFRFPLDLPPDPNEILNNNQQNTSSATLPVRPRKPGGLLQLFEDKENQPEND